MKRLMFALVIVALAVPLAAQEKTEFFGFFDNPGFRYSSVEGNSASSGYGASLRYFMTPRFSAELSIARHDRDVVAYDVSNPGAPVLLADYRVKAVPIDLISSYHFATDNRWKPYLGLGLHYLSVSGAPDAHSKLGLQLAGGVAFNVSQHFFLRADGRLLPNHNTQRYEDQSRLLLGLGWRF